MARRRESVFDMLLVLPWWVGVLFGVAGYAAVTFMLPMFWRDQMLAAVAQGIRPLGLFWLVLCLIAACASAIRAFLIRRKFDQQRGLEDIRKLSWRQFESIVGEAFRRRGFLTVENGGGGADGGVDLVLHRDGKKFFVQCKQWKVFSVGVKPIRELFGVISARGAAGGFFVASGTYTTDAREFADASGIELIDGPVLERMMVEVRSSEPFLEPTAKKRDVTSHPAPIAAVPSCPTCGGQMVMRTAKRGANAGKDFWGCSGYPRCRGIRQMGTM
jgi:restriction system protein